MTIEYIYTHEAAKLLNYSREHVTRLWRTGHIQGKRYGDRVLLDKASVLSYVPEYAHKPEKRGNKLPTHEGYYYRNKTDHIGYRDILKVLHTFYRDPTVTNLATLNELLQRYAAQKGLDR